VITVVSDLSSGDSAFGMAAIVHLNCPRCGLTITPRASGVTIEQCPRCRARAGVQVWLFASPLPAGELYAAGALPAERRETGIGPADG
jgi:hypothetical protein